MSRIPASTPCSWAWSATSTGEGGGAVVVAVEAPGVEPGRPVVVEVTATRSSYAVAYAGLEAPLLVVVMTVLPRVRRVRRLRARARRRPSRWPGGG